MPVFCTSYYINNAYIIIVLLLSIFFCRHFSLPRSAEDAKMDRLGVHTINKYLHFRGLMSQEFFRGMMWGTLPLLLILQLSSGMLNSSEGELFAMTARFVKHDG